MVGSTVVEVHNGQGGAGPLWYRSGHVTGLAIQWGSSQPYDTGFNPSVAMAGSTVVEVHNGQDGAGTLWYHLGALTGGQQIQWGPSYPYDSGWNPKVAFCCGWGLLEVHNGQAGPGPLWYRQGMLTGFAAGSTIQWSNSLNYDTGYNPSVASTYLNAVEVHNGQGGVGPLWYHKGLIEVIQ